MRKQTFIFLTCLAFATIANAQALSTWQVSKGEGVINLPNGVKSRNGSDRLPVVYDYAMVPAKNAPQWELAPTTNGQVNYGNSSSSSLDKAKYNMFTQIDITYFRAFLDLRNVSKDFKIQKATVTIGNVDDQARMLLYNSANIDGTKVDGLDGRRGGKDFTTDFTNVIRLGEINTFIILQVDDNCCGNILTGGITVRINDMELKPDTEWITKNKTIISTSSQYAEEKPVALEADKFKVNAFSVNQGQGRGIYYFGYNNNDLTTGRIVRADDANATILQIKKVDIGNNTYAFKVENYLANSGGKNAYLVASEDKKVKIEYLDDKAGFTNKGAQFISLPAFTKDKGAEQFLSFESKLKPGYYLRHSGFVLSIDELHPSELFKQDASWLIQKM